MSGHVLEKLTGWSLCNVFTCKFNHFPFWFRRKKVGPDCNVVTVPGKNDYGTILGKSKIN